MAYNVELIGFPACVTLCVVVISGRNFDIEL